ncbi:hypothetical protein [Thermocatellispora tengchongensis]|uniref:hypothetical protein n=1 Tax=Thermocatellispora tengchongensis TaxID=1073253 RepID=UPI003626BEE6
MGAGVVGAGSDGCCSAGTGGAVGVVGVVGVSVAAAALIGTSAESEAVASANAR